MRDLSNLRPARHAQQLCGTCKGHDSFPLRPPTLMTELRSAVLMPGSLAWMAWVRRCRPGEWPGSALVGGQPSKGKGCAVGKKAWECAH